MEKRTVKSVSRVGNTEDVVYNIATKNRNYFANGVLVHNCDDPNNPEKTESGVIRESTLKRYKDYSIGRRNDPKNTAIIVIQQRTHDLDISGYILKEDAEEFTKVILPTVAEADETIVFPKSGRIVERKRGDLLHPDRFGQEQVEEAKRTLGAYMFAGRHQQRPIPREGGILKEQYWQYYLSPPNCKFKIWSWDTAFKTGTQNDYSAGVLLGRWNNNYYILDVFCDRLEFPELKRRIIALHQRDKTNAVIVEDKASGQSLIQALQRDTNLPIIGQKVDRDKVTRVNAIAPMIEAGRVYLPHQAPWLADFLMQTTAFPNGSFDDIVDALSQAINYALRSSLNFTVTTSGTTRKSAGVNY